MRGLVCVVAGLEKSGAFMGCSRGFIKVAEQLLFDTVGIGRYRLALNTVCVYETCKISGVLLHMHSVQKPARSGLVVFRLAQST